jgi:inhibitor of KinA sporulation pathway (predicted exonuclease)
MIINHIATERKKHALWAFLSEYGSSGSGYSHGYLAALEDFENLLKKIETEFEPEQLSLF